MCLSDTDETRLTALQACLRASAFYHVTPFGGAYWRCLRLWSASAWRYSELLLPWPPSRRAGPQVSSYLGPAGWTRSLSSGPLHTGSGSKVSVSYSIGAFQTVRRAMRKSKVIAGFLYMWTR